MGLIKISDWIVVKKDNYKMSNSMWVECISSIRNNKTGEIREYEINEILHIGSEHPDTFNWTENDFACDCNRSLFFKRAGSKENDKDFVIECSEGKFSVNLKNKKDGKVYYREYSE